MRKHDLLALSFFAVTIAGAALCYTEFLIPGQLIYTAGLLGLSLLTKIVGASLQSWLAFVAAAGFGGILGDWFLSVAVVSAYLGVNLRAFIFKDSIYYKAITTEIFLSVIGLIIYFTSNILNHAGWQGWALPAFFILLGILVSILNYFDRKKIIALTNLGLIEIGTTAPDFTLDSSDGNKISLSDYKGQRDLLLIFVRGDWCPGCHIMLRLYERERKKFQDKNVMLFAIGPDPVGVNKAMVEKLGLEYALLSDETMEVSKKFCVQLQEDGPAKKFEHGIPLPAAFLIDKKGIVRYTSRADRAGEFLSPDLIFEILEKI